MNMENTKNIEKKHALSKVFVSTLIIGTVAAVFFVRNCMSAVTETSENMTATEIERTEVMETAEFEAEENPAPTKTASSEKAASGKKARNFPLKVTAIHLKDVKAYGVPTVVDFGSDSCIQCKKMAPILKKLNEDFQGRAAVQFLDVWKYTEGLKEFPVQTIPTQVFFTAKGKPFEPSKKLAAKIPFKMISERKTGEHTFTVHQGGLTEEEMRMIFAEMGIK